ncbi:MAG: hypothetical protein WC340_16690, partial [Kiritimatiellia bacterium]
FPCRTAGKALILVISFTNITAGEHSLYILVPMIQWMATLLIYVIASESIPMLSKYPLPNSSTDSGS